jgi:HSP20 family molecular chaperone IbpA
MAEMTDGGGGPAEDARQLPELDRDVPGAAGAGGECRRPDVVDTTSAVEVVMDVAGAGVLHPRVMQHRLVVGAASVAPRPDARHVAERSSGGFARAVRLSGAVDASRAKAFVQSGVLRVVLPRIEDRRGRLILIPVEHA